jgi:hypothetical protein
MAGLLLAVAPLVIASVHFAAIGEFDLLDTTPEPFIYFRF